MYASKLLQSDHKDLIHDVAFNWYGTHLATCSSDRSVKVWVWDSDKSTWHCSASWKSHSGAVWKVTWAHPEFGQVLATCSFDRTATIWEEIPGSPPTGGKASSFPPNTVSNSLGANSTGESDLHWAKRSSLVDSRTAITDVKFAPKHLGLLVATCSSDGMVRVYEAPDVMNLTQWSLQHEIGVKVSCSCLSWNLCLNKLQPPLLAVGSDDRSIATLNVSGSVSNATGGSTSGKVFIYEYNETIRRWSRVETLTTITSAVYDLAFAPNMGRSYNVLAVASKDLRVVTLKPIASSGSNNLASNSNFDGTTEVATEAGETNPSKYEIRLAGQFNDHQSTVWRVCWNVTGTILASSGDDGHVKLWKSNHLDNWQCVATLRGDGAPTNNPEGDKTRTGMGEAYKAPTFPPGMAFSGAGGAVGGKDSIWN